jgi:uncharacterized protein (TIGR01244 family)
MRRFFLMRQWFLALLLVAPFALAGEPGPGAIKVDLDEVVEQGSVEPVDGITSAGQPDEAALEVFAESGYVAVIDMRTAREDRGFDEPRAVAGLGMEYIAFPIGGDDITLDKAKELDALLAQYDEPVLLHCGSGNRVGALLALREYLESGDAEKALEMGRNGGLTGLESNVRNALEDEADQQ